MLTVPPMTRSPAVLATGIDSPVSIDSSTALAPDDDLAVDGNALAGLHEHDIAAAHVADGHFRSRPSRTTRAVCGCSFISARSAVEVCRFARASSVRPASTSAMMMITAS